MSNEPQANFNETKQYHDLVSLAAELQLEIRELKKENSVLISENESLKEKINSKYIEPVTGVTTHKLNHNFHEGEISFSTKVLNAIHKSDALSQLKQKSYTIITTLAHYQENADSVVPLKLVQVQRLTKITNSNTFHEALSNACKSGWLSYEKQDHKQPYLFQVKIPDNLVDTDNDEIPSKSNKE